MYVCIFITNLGLFYFLPFDHFNAYRKITESNKFMINPNRIIYLKFLKFAAPKGSYFL